MNFILKGLPCVLFRKGVKQTMRGVKPTPIRKYYVIVNRKRYSPKQVISTCTGLGLSEFGTVDAAPILIRLGFKLHSL